ncbi:MAG: hypothetical protein H7Y01_03540 [Ferruginibacter sp.]|nr:hypothetical protein [Chitinophagaceae bacterium]
MKKVLVLLLLSPLFSLAQDTASTGCKLSRETDPFTKMTKLSTGFIFLDGGSVTIDADSKEIDVLFSIEGADKCFDNNSMAAIFFEGVKTKSSSRNGGTMNCEGLFHFIFKNTASNISLLQKLMTQPINHIVFTGNNKKESTLTIGPMEQQKLLALATCLVKEAKTLIK